MIISASRRTDIPAFYSDWFFQRLKEGFAYVRNPMNPHQISKVTLAPDVVDGMVFWTKNPTPMLHRLDALQGYTYYFQFTLTPYASDIERYVPSKNDVIIPAFQTLSSRIGRDRVVWRYDPILLSEKYTMQYHRKYFSVLCDRLAPFTEKCTISFLDTYRNILRSLQSLGIRPPTPDEIQELAYTFSEIASAHGLLLDTCAETADLSQYGIGHASCIDRERLERIGGFPLRVERDKNQREACGCVYAIDLGAYNSCANGCVYCYANFNQTLVDQCRSNHDPRSPLLYGEVTAQDHITTREAKSFREDNLTLDARLQFSSIEDMQKHIANE